VAASHGNIIMVRFLLDMGAAVDRPDATGQTALILAARHQKHKYQKTAIVLLQAGASVNARDRQGRDALFYAALHRDVPLIHTLARADATGVMAVAAALGLDDV
jgi:ankyrin repeat protein